MVEVKEKKKTYFGKSNIYDMVILYNATLKKNKLKNLMLKTHQQ